MEKTRQTQYTVYMVPPQTENRSQGMLKPPNVMYSQLTQQLEVDRRFQDEGVDRNDHNNDGKLSRVMKDVPVVCIPSAI